MLTSEKSVYDHPKPRQLLDDFSEEQEQTMTDNTEQTSLPVFSHDNSRNNVQSKETFVGTNIKLKNKRVSKKKKKKLQSESSTGKDSSTVSNNNSNVDKGIESTTGPCEIRNGIIKIRLSKLIDIKKDDNDYEVSLCESDALIGCKALSVPLSPLAPAVYSTYCENLKKKKKTCSKKFKKGGKRNSLFKALINNEKDEEETQPCSEMHELQENQINHEICETSNFNDTVPQERKNTNASLCTSVTSVNSNLLCKNTNVQLSNTGDLAKTELPLSQNSHSEINSNSFSKVNLNGTEIKCSINLSLLDRVPDKSYESNKLNHSNQIDDRKKYKKVLNSESSSNVLPENSTLEVNSCVIKKERFTPPLCELSRTEHNGSENIDSPVNSFCDIAEDEACPNFISAYSADSAHNAMDKIDNYVSENEQQDLHSRKQVLIKKDTLPILQSDAWKDVDPLVLNDDSLYKKIKLESSKSTVSDYDKWNEFRGYRWCHDYSDISYNENGLFKGQYNIGNHRLWPDSDLKKPYSSEYYLSEAKKLKYQADKEIDRMVQAMKYLEAVLYFILTGNAMEHSYIDTDRVHTMYKETLALIRFISSKFQKLRNASCRNIDNKLTVLSLRCQSLLYLKMYQLRRDEVRYLHRSISSFLKTEHECVPAPEFPSSAQYFRQGTKHQQISPSHLGSSCSLTPSPAGSTASVSSHSSGYSSELGWNSPVANTLQIPQLDLYSDAITITHTKYKMLQQQSLYLANLHLSHDLWEHADYLSSKEHSREFFMELDEECGCLSLHSPFSALVHYVRKGIYKLKDGT